MSEQKWERRSKDRPEEIFKAALAVFGASGYRASKLSDVAAQAGISKGLIYRYFDSKEDLLRKALDFKMEKLQGALESHTRSRVQSTESFLVDFCHQAWEHWQSEEWGNLYRLLLGEIAQELPELYEKWIKGAWLPVRKHLVQILLDGQNSGEFSSDFQADETARLIQLGLSHAVYLQKHKGLAKWDLWTEQKYFDNTLSLILRGIRKGCQ